MTNCKVCNVEINSTQKYCSQKCRSRFHYINNKEKCIKRAEEWNKNNYKRHKEHVKKWKYKDIEKYYAKQKIKFGTDYHREYRREYLKREIPSEKNMARLATRKLRLAIFKRDNFQCIICNSKKELQVHHKRYSEFTIDDIVTVCKECHWNIHGKKRRLLT